MSSLDYCKPGGLGSRKGRPSSQHFSMLPPQIYTAGVCIYIYVLKYMQIDTLRLQGLMFTRTPVDSLHGKDRRERFAEFEWTLYTYSPYEALKQHICIM